MADLSNLTPTMLASRLRLMASGKYAVDQPDLQADMLNEAAARLQALEREVRQP